MRASVTKNMIIWRFLDLVRRYVPVEQACFVTLGGVGMEARIWQEVGVATGNGWLIERNQRLSSKLIRSFPYSYCADLETFPGVFESVRGWGAAVDAFHLDLCGTIEKNMDAFALFLPLLIGKSEGRCLAITVADQRANPSQAAPATIRSWAGAVMGDSLAMAACQRLVTEQTLLSSRALTKTYLSSSDPEKGMYREIGFFLHFLHVLMGRGRDLFVMPDRVERYVYISKYSGQPARMRTYLFHFSPTERRAPAEAAATLWQRWHQNGLCICRRGSFYSLAIRDDQLPAWDSCSSIELAERVSGIEINNNLVAIQMDLLRARAFGGEKGIEQVYKQAYSRLGLVGGRYTKSRRRLIGALLLLTQGECRGKFVSNAMTEYGAGVLDELGGLYSAIIGSIVSKRDLLREVETID